ncbi:serine/threonine-protein kinase [Actinomadura sediminis]|uniref:non-specific serine/threonine protein kinase n=1 Tax=Actinomadura sediminis TaxID=1038904 RepID=A0ABW3F153_9ACTN
MPNEPNGERLLARRYRLVTQVGRGGMGTVWQAHDEVLGRDVAVKEVILPHGLTDEERAVHHKRTFREARTAARLGHPGVVTVYDVVEEDGRPWIIMELIRSRSLDQVIKQDGPLDPLRAAEIGRQMLAALHAAHQAGVLHRDVKPSNVLITGTGRTGERAVLTDFGIAIAAGDATLTQTGLVMGSPAYIAPERARGRKAGPASDLWSLGVALYAMVHGRSPFERSEPMAALVAVISEEPDPPEKGGPLVPIIEGLLRKNPDQRMDAIEAGALLDELVRQETIDTQHTMAVESAAAGAAEPASPDATRIAPPLPPSGPDGAPGGPNDTARDPWRAEPAAQGTAQGVGGAPTRLAGIPGLPRLPGNQAPGGPGGPGPGSRNLVVVAVIVLIVVLVITGIALASGDDEKPARNESANTGANASAGTSAPATTEPSPTEPTQEETPSTSVPAGFRLYEDGTGYKVAIPDDWSGPESKKSSDFFYSPDRKAYIQIDQTDDPGDSAIDDWRRQERGGLGWPGYDQIKIAPTGDQPPVPDTGDGDDSADWEFTYDGKGGTRMHVLNRGFVANDHGYAILLSAPHDGWDGLFDELQPVYRSFTPAED